MRHLLQRHAMPVTAHFASSLVLAYALPAAVLEPFLAPGLTLDTYRDLGFLAIALVETRRLRPSFLPALFGLNFRLSGYRIFTRYRTRTGRTLRGLRILRSDTNRRSMLWLGNLLTHYRYEPSKWSVSRTAFTYEIQVRTGDGAADLHVEADMWNRPSMPPPGSPFPNLMEARHFAGPLPFTFDYEAETESILRVQGVRERWRPRPVSVTVHRNTFLEQEAFRNSGAVLANAFYLEDVPYRWCRGIREKVP